MDKRSEEIIELQGKDDTLETCRENARNRVVKQTRSGQTSWEYVEGTLCRQYKGTDGQKHVQLVVPKILRTEVMKLGHETMMAGHLGTRKTIDRITSEFYWPGCKSDIRRFVSHVSLVNLQYQKEE